MKREARKPAVGPEAIGLHADHGSARPGRSRALDGEDDIGSVTSVEQATTLIRQAIVSGRYGPGERIKISEAAKRFGVSAMPVREALRKLEGEGIIGITPNRGATVRAVDHKFIEDVFEVRTTLQVMILGRCIEGLTLNKLKRLEDLLAGYRGSAETGDALGAINAIRMFHEALFEFGGNLEATRLFHRGWDTILALRLRFGYSQERLDTIAVELRQLIDALRSHNAREAEAIIRMHNRAGMDELLAKLAEAGRSDWGAQARLVS